MVIETWKLINPFIKSVKYGDLDYSNDELIEIELGLRYDWAELTIPTTGKTLQTDGSFKDGGPPTANTEIIGGSKGGTSDVVPVDVVNGNVFFNGNDT